METDIPRQLKFVRDNNTTTKRSEISQRILKHIVKEIGINKVTEWNDRLRENNEEKDYQKNDLNNFIDCIEAYTERHFERLKNFYKKACYLDFVLAQSGQLFSENEGK